MISGGIRNIALHSSEAISTAGKPNGSVPWWRW
jgi:hypothetical protein